MAFQRWVGPHLMNHMVLMPVLYFLGVMSTQPQTCNLLASGLTMVNVPIVQVEEEFL